MAQKLKLRTHTDLDLPLVEEMQHVADRVLVPNCIRKTQAFYLGVGVLCLSIGAGSVLASRQLVVGAIFGLLGLAMLGWGAMAYRIAARKTCRQMEKAVQSTDYVLEKESLWAANGRGDFHYLLRHAAGGHPGAEQGKSEGGNSGGAAAVADGEVPAAHRGPRLPLEGYRAR